MNDKIDSFKRVEEKCNRTADQTDQLAELIEKTKKDLHQSHLDMLDKNEQTLSKLKLHEDNLTDTVEDTKYWMD
jgi:predicted component of viral defense system (DUF524 family)